jgi:hypothetical protein
MIEDIRHFLMIMMMLIEPVIVYEVDSFADEVKINK